MDSKSTVLLKTLLKSTSTVNIIKHTKDKKKKKKLIGALVAYAFIYLLMAGYCVLMPIGYGEIGLAKSIPSLSVLLIVLMTFIFSLLRSNGYLFGFKEYDMLMSMPFEIKEVVGCKFLYMYIKNLPTIMIISLSMMIGYGIYERPAIYIYPLWIVLSVLAPLIPNVIASSFGVLIAKVSSRFKIKKIIQTILTFAIILASFGIQFFVRTINEDTQIEDVLLSASDKFGNVIAYYPPAKWFEDGIVNGSIAGIALFLGVSILLFLVFITVVSKFYIQINSRLSAHERAKNKSGLSIKKHSVANAIAYKEFKRMIGSVPYFTNAGFGYLFCIITSVVVLFVDAEKIISLVVQGAPVSVEMIKPVIPVVLYFFIGMVSVSCYTMSLEGKNYWIMQSMPISKKTLINSKMLFQMYLNVPTSILAAVCYGICFRADFVYILLYITSLLAMGSFSTTCGMFCGLKFMKLDWENEMEVIKQGTAVTVYLLPNLFITMFLMVGAVFGGIYIGGKLVLVILTLIYAAVAALFYMLVMKKTK